MAPRTRNIGERQSVLITGASSGIGAALARACAGPGATLHLSGRHADRLDGVAAECRGRGATAHTAALDVRDADAVARWIGSAGQLDVVIANAGIGAGVDARGPEEAAQVRAILATNLDGALNVVLPALAAMQSQPLGADGRRGRIAAVASIAAFIPSPGAPAYCASKAALDSFMVATAASARRVGVALTSVCPGFIRTPMTVANAFPMPGLMDADRAAGIILRGIAAGRMRIAFPWWMAAGVRATALLPASVVTALLSRAGGKAPLPPTDGTAMSATHD
ncbi:MAG TPA: SDR family NAD(P)-dependent oxidoreductase [Acetobacteraceae bacterium]|jgi:short-subunit dehydrogenase|nr:SDR family NAD(P)-dependent oxidoreductase [Acetobacteraceae bacterium]